MATRAKLYVCTVLGIGLGVFSWCLGRWQPAEDSRFLVYLLLTLAAATLKVQLPRVAGTISLSFIFLLVAIAQFPLSEAVLLAAGAAIVQCVWRPRVRPRVVQIAFSAAALVISVTVTQTAAAQIAKGTGPGFELALLAAEAFLFYATNTVLVTTVICLAESRPLRGVWQQCHLWAFPYYLVGAMLLDVTYALGYRANWRAPLLLLPLMLLVHTCYRAIVDRATEPAHVKI